ncbi:hypothetical protein UY3_00162 [Chelonia mydas]|uniref:Uncharacterized protein n=1 Tax=Chelonia mydas TaxID=8469 RepID=M7BXG3_CHEMY|nr:hypothetical protein UY3_00162 [Chelonia mydas]
MEPTRLHTDVASIVNTSRIILQYVQSLARSRQHEDDCEKDMDTDFPESTGCGNWDIMAAARQVDTVERRFWAWETSTDSWDHIVLQVWDDSQWLRNFCMHKATFMELCELLSPSLKRTKNEPCPDSGEASGDSPVEACNA